MSEHKDYRMALAAAPTSPVDADHPVTGLAEDDCAIANLWEIQDRLKASHGGRLTAGIGEDTWDCLVEHYGVA